MSILMFRFVILNDACNLASINSKSTVNARDAESSSARLNRLVQNNTFR